MLSSFKLKILDYKYQLLKVIKVNQCYRSISKSSLNMPHILQFYNVSIKTESIDWLNWSDHELGCVDSYVLKNLNYNDTGVYKCEIHDLSDSRTWIANVVSVTVGSQQVNNFLSNEKFWILFVIVSVVIVSLNLGVLLKNMLGL